MKRRSHALEGAADNAMLAVQETNAVRALFVERKCFDGRKPPPWRRLTRLMLRHGSGRAERGP